MQLLEICFPKAPHKGHLLPGVEKAQGRPECLLVLSLCVTTSPQTEQQW